MSNFFRGVRVRLAAADSAGTTTTCSTSASSAASAAFRVVALVALGTTAWFGTCLVTIAAGVLVIAGTASVAGGARSGL